MKSSLKSVRTAVKSTAIAIPEQRLLRTQLNSTEVKWTECFGLSVKIRIFPKKNTTLYCSNYSSVFVVQVHSYAIHRINNPFPNCLSMATKTKSSGLFFLHWRHPTKWKAVTLLARARGEELSLRNLSKIDKMDADLERTVCRSNEMWMM